MTKAEALEHCEEAATQLKESKERLDDVSPRKVDVRLYEAIAAQQAALELLGAVVQATVEQAKG